MSHQDPPAEPASPVQCLSVGVLVADHLCAPIDHLPRAGELVLSDSLPLAVGGCAANAAIDLRRLGHSVACVGCVGDDPFGRFIIETLQSSGVDTATIESSSLAPTSGTLIVNVRGEDRRFIHNMGANTLLSAQHLTDHALRQARVLYVGGYLLMPAFDPHELADLFRRARALGVRTVLDVVLPGPGDHWSRLEPPLAETDVFLPNDDEAADLTGLSDATQQAERFRAAGAETVVITSGEHGALLLNEASHLRIPPCPVDFVDGTGAGDAFDAGYISGLLAGLEPRDCLLRGAILGASCVRAVGATKSVFTMDQLDDYQQRHKIVDRVSIAEKKDAPPKFLFRPRGNSMRIALFCSGGDAPGMNACVRAVVRSTIAAGHEPIGIMGGYQGILDEAFFAASDGTASLDDRSVSNIQQRGGTILGSSRCSAFHESAGQKRAATILDRHRIDALIPIGGDGTLRGAMALSAFWPRPIIACPGTIDNDLLGTDFTIGFHTAVATAVEAIDKLRDTADSHERMFIVEVMGRHSGYIALYSAIAGGAEIACLPETPSDVPAIVGKLNRHKSLGSRSVIMVVAEGDEFGGAHEFQSILEAAECPYPSRVVMLGHVQRGGSPVPADRLLASRLGDFAARSVISGQTGQLAGEVDGRLVHTPFAEAVEHHRPVPAELVALLETLSV